ncbi:hypothetical protein [Thalassotalea agarivorans]|uniref:Uncharacterized protein n=1 Tax=Thalassotalea agarivorans TaxID=349064 RepID=A0A1I0E6Z4_THASX|nr:hypothetical protein [Thalassotalea agarivorans]SET40826.1 hypothetical protein SAMN05660429_01751 [Thalassotalea agarivorans]
MEFLPKLFAKKFSPYTSYAHIKLFGLLFCVAIASSIAGSKSQFLGELVFFNGMAIVSIVLAGFASAHHYREKSEQNASTPLLEKVISSSLFDAVSKPFAKVAKLFFIITFHGFLLFSVIAFVMPTAIHLVAS